MLAFALFFFSFPINRKIPVWPHLNLAELYSLWFLFVTPITTLIAFIVLIRRRWMGPSSILAWFIVVASFVVNALVLWGSTPLLHFEVKVLINAVTGQVGPSTAWKGVVLG